MLNWGNIQGSFGIKATDPVFTNISKHSIPHPEEDGKIGTLNKTGFMTPELDPISQELIAYAAKCTLPVLDIGAAYGVTSIPALKQGATVIANDISEQHLLLLRQLTPQKYWKNLYLNKAHLPQETNFPPRSISAILLRRVTHFLSPIEIEETLDKAALWLVKGGNLFIVTMSPYHRLLKHFIEQYESRWQAGDPWPGIVENMHDYAPLLKDNIPNVLHVMDAKPICQALQKRHFSIKKSFLFDFEHSEEKTLGYYGVIAEI